MTGDSKDGLASLDVSKPIWETFFWVAPLVVVGTREPDGAIDFAPKHMAMPLGWDNHFGFVCTPRHRTYQNAKRERAFTVSYPRPDQIVLTSLAAAPRCGTDDKPSLAALPTIPATVVDGALMRDAYLHFECRLDDIIDGFGDNSLITGKIVAASADVDVMRVSDQDDQDLLMKSPLLAYLPPGRYARIDRSYSFPFPAGFRR
jgi:flavin reductase (DIM6/NTAB) family NADH-FMN oxidoreductase RutF